MDNTLPFSQGKYKASVTFFKYKEQMDDSIKDLMVLQSKIESEIYETSVRMMLPLYTKRREAVKNVDRFWSLVFDESGLLSDYIEYDDTQATDALCDLWIDYDENNVKNCTITFEFGPNPCIESKPIKKQFKYDTQKDCYISTAVEIPWKTGKDLTSLSKTSFFTWFAFERPEGVHAKLSTIADTIIEEIYPNAFEYYRASQEEDDIIDPYDISETDEEEGDTESGNKLAEDTR